MLYVGFIHMPLVIHWLVLQLWTISWLPVARGHVSFGNSILVALMIKDLDVDVVVAHLTRVNVYPAGLSKCQEGAEAQQIDCGDKGEHRCPRACGFDQIPREIHH